MPLSSEIARPDFIDRSPSTKDQSFSGTLAPHSLTVRWQYTVPSNRSAAIGVAECYVLRATVATVSSTVNDMIRTNSGVTIIINDARMISNNIGDKEGFVIPISYFIYSGGFINGTTADVSTGGTAYHFVAISIIELDK